MDKAWSARTLWCSFTFEASAPYNEYVIAKDIGFTITYLPCSIEVGGLQNYHWSRSDVKVDSIGAFPL